MNRDWVWPWGILAALVVLILLIAVVVVVLRASRSKVPMVPAGIRSDASPADGAPAAVPVVDSIAAVFALRRSFVSAMRELRKLAPRASQRLAASWVLVLGEGGSGKSSMVNALPLARMGAACFLRDQFSPCAWHFFEQGVVLDVAGSLLLDRATGQGDDRSWKMLISLLQRYRAERPADAIVLAVPCTDLVGPECLTREAAHEKAARVEARLAELQRGLGLCLPVYVVVTKCDRIPGFSAFSRSVPAERATDMLGWSSPYSVDAVFDPGWVDEALNVTLRSIQHAEFEAFARRDPVALAGDFVLLPTRVEAAAPVLRDFLSRVFRPTAYAQGPVLRGIYFTGDPVRAEPIQDAIVDAAGMRAVAGSTEGAPLVAPVTPPGAPRRPFLRDLFSEKVFAERGLARPGARVFPSRNRAVRLMQVSAVVIVALGPLALWLGTNGIRIGGWQITSGVRADAAGIDTLLDTVRVSVKRMALPGTRGSAGVFTLLNAMADVRATRLWSGFMPGSVIAPLGSQVRSAIEKSFQDVLLPELREGLEHRMSVVLGMPRELDAVDRAQVPTSLPEYLIDLDSLARNIGRFDRLRQRGSGSTHELAAIVEYLYREKIPDGFFDHDTYYRRALLEARADSVRVGDTEKGRAVARAGEIASDAYDKLVSRLSGDPVARDTGMERADSDIASADIEAIVALRAFLDPDGPVEQALAAIQSPFVFGDGFATRVRAVLATYTDLLAGQISNQFGGRGVTSAPTRRALDALLRQRFMRAPTGHAIGTDIPAGAEIALDARRLHEAIAIYADYEAFLTRGLDSLPDRLRGHVRRLATVQVGAAMGDAMASAVVSRTVLPNARESMRDVRDRVASFERSAPKILRLLDVFDQVGATAEFDALADVSMEEASTTLAHLDTAFDWARRFVLPADAAASWNGRAPFSAVTFGDDRRSLNDFLTSELEKTRTMAALARPVVSFLATRAAAGSAGPPTLRRWLDVIDAVDNLERNPPSGPLATLARAVHDEIDSVDVRSCLRRAPRVATGTDVLSRRVTDLRLAVWRRCTDIALTGARTAYGRVEVIFRTRLAGRFPFSAADAVPDAQPADIVEFLRAYDLFAESAPDLVKALGATSPRLAAFLGDVEGIRKFFASLVDSAATARPVQYDFLIDFRVNRAREMGANQIAEWWADVGSQHAEIGAPAALRHGRWRAGDSVRVTLRWATGSAFVPKSVSAPGASVRDGTVTVATGGPWGLLRLLSAYESDVADPEGGQGVSIVVRTAGRQTPNDVNGTARAYLRVRLYDPDTKAELSLPRFPSAAPPLAAEGGR
jgi:type VI secretion system protein ImpL